MLRINSNHWTAIDELHGRSNANCGTCGTQMLLCAIKALETWRDVWLGNVQSVNSLETSGRCFYPLLRSWDAQGQTKIHRRMDLKWSFESWWHGEQVERTIHGPADGMSWHLMPTNQNDAPTKSFDPPSLGSPEMQEGGIMTNNVLLFVVPYGCAVMLEVSNATSYATVLPAVLRCRREIVAVPLHVFSSFTFLVKHEDIEWSCNLLWRCSPDETFCVQQVDHKWSIV